MRWRFAVATVAAITEAMVAITPTRAQQSSLWTACSSETLSPDAAIESCTKIIQSGRETQQNLAIAYVNRGGGYDQKGDIARAIADFSEAIKLDSGNAAAYYNRGTVYAKKGDLDRAIADFTKGIELDPKDADAYYNRGLTYDHKGDYDRAIADYSKVIELDPKYVDAYDSRCWARATSSQPALALTDCDAALRLKPDDTYALDSRGFAYYMLARYDEALADYDAAPETGALALRPRHDQAEKGRHHRRRRHRRGEGDPARHRRQNGALRDEVALGSDAGPHGGQSRPDLCKAVIGEPCSQ